VRAQYALAIAALDHLQALAESVEASDAAVERMRSDLQRQVAATRRRLDQPTHADHARASPLRSAILDVQAEELARLRTAGEISADAFRHVQRQLDLEHARMTD
jgi:monovalent cation/hydrogen antiporter